MKICYTLLLLLTLPLAGCVIVRPLAVYLQNTTMQPLTARLHYREWVHPTDTVHLRYQILFARGLRYAPLLLTPSRKIFEQLTATLPVSATDTAATFTIPAHSTVLLYATLSHGPLDLPEDVRLYLQKAGATPRILDKEQFWQGGRFRQGGGFWYTIPE